ncbi:hypothetical protein FQN60_009778 [Etheostoma spectabile]|uniref:Uncharacterized protein n=1 Tax=Etheostoma spectabile TaxID=54343 RepID=A0A5J5DK48_9PERO|nr:hypothetical protein FQN60_009778 [Etheostoma spectabile]
MITLGSPPPPVLTIHPIDFVPDCLRTRALQLIKF